MVVDGHININITATASAPGMSYNSSGLVLLNSFGCDATGPFDMMLPLSASIGDVSTGPAVSGLHVGALTTHAIPTGSGGRACVHVMLSLIHI